MAVFQAGRFALPLHRTYVMGILNVTPDSFSDGGRYCVPQAAVAHALEMARDGADIIDIGGQSTRPGYTAIPPEEEWARIAQVVPRWWRPRACLCPWTPSTPGWPKRHWRPGPLSSTT